MTFTFPGPRPYTNHTSSFRSFGHPPTSSRCPVLPSTWFLYPFLIWNIPELVLHVQIQKWVSLYPLGTSKGRPLTVLVLSIYLQRTCHLTTRVSIFVVLVRRQHFTSSLHWNRTWSRPHYCDHTTPILDLDENTSSRVSYVESGVFRRAHVSRPLRFSVKLVDLHVRESDLCCLHRNGI